MPSTSSTSCALSSSRRSVSQGAAQKTAREKIKQSRREKALFFAAVFRAVPQLTERLEEATCAYAVSLSIR